MEHRSIPDPRGPARRSVLAGLAGACALWSTSPGRAEEALTVFAAASLKPALDEIAAGWAAPVAISYAGSGALARQVAQGAPADVILLAAEDWMDWLIERDALAAPPVAVAGNELVLVGPPGAAPCDLSLGPMRDRLGADGRLAMGDPMSVPAGRYAQQSLESLGLWDALAPRALFAENVRAALAYVARGDVPLGLVYASDAVGTGVSLLDRAAPDTHAPIVYPGAVLRGAAPGAMDFVAHVARQGSIFRAHGFAPPPPS